MSCTRYSDRGRPIRAPIEAIVDVSGWHPGRVIGLGGSGPQFVELDLPTLQWEVGTSERSRWSIARHASRLAPRRHDCMHLLCWLTGLLARARA